MPSTLVSESSSRCSGERLRVTEVSIVAIWPIWVCMPVAVTTMVAVPRVTEVFWKSMLVRSPRATSAEASTPASLGIGALSPVSAASCASRVAERTIRPSAGTMSPASSWTTSPGTTSVAGTSARAPSRTTRAWGTCIRARASTLARAVSSCRVPSRMLSTTSSATRTPVATSPMRRLTTTTATSMRFIGSRSWTAASANADGGFSAVIALGPCDASRDDASVALSPATASEPACARTSSALRAYGGTPSTGSPLVATGLALMGVLLRTWVPPAPGPPAPWHLKASERVLRGHHPRRVVATDGGPGGQRPVCASSRPDVDRVGPGPGSRARSGRRRRSEKSAMARSKTSLLPR